MWEGHPPVVAFNDGLMGAVVRRQLDGGTGRHPLRELEDVSYRRPAEAVQALVLALFLTGSTITSCITGGGSVFVTFALNSRCLRLYCSGYLRSSSQAAAVHVDGRVISTTSWTVLWSSPLAYRPDPSSLPQQTTRRPPVGSF